MTVLPLDSVIGAHAAQRGLEVVYGSLDEGFAKLRHQRFDCIIISNLLHLIRDPVAVVRQSTDLLKTGGTLVLAGPNFDYLPIKISRVLGRGSYSALQSFELGGINCFGIRSLLKACLKIGLQPKAIAWQTVQTTPVSGSTRLPGWPRRLLSEIWRTFGRLESRRSEITHGRSVPVLRTFLPSLATHSWIVQTQRAGLAEKVPWKPLDRDREPSDLAVLASSRSSAR